MEQNARPCESRLPARLNDLHRLLVEQIERHEALLGVIQRKLDAMRRCDAAGILACVREESERVGGIQEREGMRRSLMVLIGRDLALPAAEARQMTVGQLGGRIAEPPRNKLRTAAERLTRVLGEVNKVNRVAGVLARQMMEHHARLLDAMTRGFADPPIYAARGRRPGPWAPPVFDAVG